MFIKLFRCGSRFSTLLLKCVRIRSGAHLSQRSFPAVSLAKPLWADLSMTSPWRTGSSGGGRKTKKASHYHDESICTNVLDFKCDRRWKWALKLKIMVAIFIWWIQGVISKYSAVASVRIGILTDFIPICIIMKESLLTKEGRMLINKWQMHLTSRTSDS